MDQNGHLACKRPPENEGLCFFCGMRVFKSSSPEHQSTWVDLGDEYVLACKACAESYRSGHGDDSPDMRRRFLTGGGD